jgi:DNA repair protein RAD50
LNATAEALARFPARADELALAAARARAASEKARAAEQEARKAAASDVPLEVLRVQAANAHAAARRSREQLDALRRQLIASEDHERELRAEVARLCESAGSLQRLQLEREAAQRASEELRAQAAGLDTRVASLSSEMDDAQGRVDRLSRERNEERARRQKSEREAEAQLAVIEREAGDFLAQVSALRRAEERLAMLQTLERAAEDAEEMCRRQRDAVAPLLHALNEGRAAVAASEERLRVVERNRQLREREEQLSELQRELAQRRAEAGDSEPVRRELARLESELKAVVSTRDKSRGVLEAQEREAASYEQSLASPSYRDVEEAHRVEFSAACLLHKVCDDLEVYARGLDRALMRYHALKMEEINRELSEFWRAVYNGKDIDEIAIRSDHSEKGGRRAYDYRVVMRRGDTEMDMRGRCSAGQRVLASLLIRLALAQAFSVRCGVLALDEPTTNLDASNAIAFARILARLVNDRRRQDHFQLVVITHDSKFMEELGRLVGTEYYYRVFKEADQTSRIQRQPFEVDL